MNEEQWRNGNDELAMLLYLQNHHGCRPQVAAPSEEDSFRGIRKIALFECACCRRIWDRLTDPRSREAVEVFERCIEGEATAEEWQSAQREAQSVRAAHQVPRTPAAYPSRAALAVANLAGQVLFDLRHPTYSYVNPSVAVHALEAVPCNFLQLREYYMELPGIPQLLRCVFGNPFRSVAFDPSWRTPDAVAVANTIYYERRFDELPILADALEESGCNDSEILGHARAAEKHVRGCWVVDRILELE
jgi:hypothetical protein